MSTSYGATYGYGLNKRQLESINQETLALFLEKRFAMFEKYPPHSRDFSRELSGF